MWLTPACPISEKTMKMVTLTTKEDRKYPLLLRAWEVNFLSLYFLTEETGTSKEHRPDRLTLPVYAVEIKQAARTERAGPITIPQPTVNSSTRAHRWESSNAPTEIMEYSFYTPEDDRCLLVWSAFFRGCELGVGYSYDPFGWWDLNRGSAMLADVWESRM